MSRFSIQFLSEKRKITPLPNVNLFNKDMNYYICSSGGCGSTAIFNYLSLFGNVYHVHDRYPPKKLQYVGKENTNEEVYSEWFNNVEIPEDKLKNYKVIFIYRNPIKVIFCRFVQANGPNINHLKNIKCDNNGNINIFDIVRTKRDLYKMEDFFDNYMIPTNRNYNIYAVKYEMFWSNISLFNKIIGIPDIKELYPIQQEKPKRFDFINELTFIYSSLINKMNSLRFIELVRPIEEHENDLEH